MIDLDEIKSRIDPQYADTPGTESHERKMLCDEIEALRRQLIGMQGRFEKDQERIKCQAEQLAESESERLEQARLLGMSGEREAGLLAEIERLKGECLSLAIEATPGIQLASSQAREQQLRKALEALNEHTRERCCSLLIVDEAIALPQDTAAIEAMISKTGEVMRGRIHSTLHSELFDSTLRRNLCSKVRALPGVTLEDLR